MDLTAGSLNGSLPTTLQHLTSLRELYLGRNNLTGSIPEDMFTNMKSLELLYLAFNNFEGTVPNFSNLVHLQQVMLHENRFNKINSDTFANSSSLELISLSSQGVLNLQDYAFRDTQSQADIELGGNVLTTIPRGAFSGRRNANLNLQSLGLRILESKAFEKTSNLTLRLEGNAFYSIAADVFENETILSNSECEDFAGWESLCEVMAWNMECDPRTCSEQVTYVT